MVELNEENYWSEKIIGAAIEVHRLLGPGLPESIYEEALCAEMEERGIPYARQVHVAVMFKKKKIKDHRLDLIVAKKVVVELKAVDRTARLVEAKLLSYVRFANCRLGLMLNFHEVRLIDGVRRVISTIDHAS
jgi:GxxExxY protein